MNDHQHPPTSEVDATDRAASRTIRRTVAQWWLIALCGVIAAASAFVVSSTRPEEYRAISTIEVGSSNQLRSYLTDDLVSSESSPERDKAGAVAQIELPDVRDRASRLLGDAVSSDDIADAVEVVSFPDSDVVQVVATSQRPKTAQNIANAVVEGFIAQRSELARDQLAAITERTSEQLAALTRAERQTEIGRSLRQRLEGLTVLGTIEDAGVTITQRARLPTTPVSPSPGRDAILGLLGGLVLGIVIALMRARIDDRIRDAAELAEHWDLPVAGLVPQTSSLKDQGAQLPGPAALEALALARTNLRYLHVGGDVRTVLITSALEGEGKSTIGWNLAIASALSSMRVLVIEADLRRPKLTSRLGLSGPGFSEVLAGMTTTQHAIREVEITAADGQVVARVDVLPAGLTPPSPIALLEGEQAGRVLADLRSRYDVVYIDSPPATTVGDAVALVGAVDGVLIVSRLGTVRRGAYDRLREILSGANAPVLAQLINSDASAKGFAYYSSYAAPVRAQSATPSAASPASSATPATGGREG